MFGGQKGIIPFNIFKWKWRHESSLTAGLLNDVPPEIELSDYHRAPSTGSESPSGLLNGESLNVETITDLDLFFERLYSYYCEKGLWCIIIKWIVELLSLAFIICFSGFFLLFVDWNGLRNAKCGMDAVEYGTKPCDLSKEALHEHPLMPFTWVKAIIVGYLGMLSIYWIFCFLKFFAQLKDTLKIRQFYYNSLNVTDEEIQTMSWASILEKVVQVQSSQQLCVVKDLAIHDVVMRLMRKENYLIGMLNKGVLAFPISCWFPGAGPTVKIGPNGVPRRLILTKTLEWTLNWCILQSMFDRNFCIRRDFISDPKTLKKRLMIVGLVMLLLSPFLVIFMLVYLFLRHAEQFYNHPSTASSRRWSNLSKWIFREFNEVDHFFKHRMNSSIVYASDYLRQFPSPKITILAKFISFVSGGFAAILIIIAFLEESLLEGHIFGRTLFWYAAVLGTVTALSRTLVKDELPVRDPQGAMSLVVQHTHYMPKRWRGKENTKSVRMEFETLFQYTGMMLLEEMASIFLTPYLLMFVVPKSVDDILQFIEDFTVRVEGVGHVCSFSIFNFQNHGNGKYGSPFNASRSHRSSQGKMEKSFMSFQSSYPSWEPNSQGKLFLSTLWKFNEQQFQVQGINPAYMMPPWLQQGNLNFMGFGHLSREMPFNSPAAGGNQWGSVQMNNGEQKNYPYILDRYYTFQPQPSTDAPREVPSRPLDVIDERTEDFSTSFPLRRQYEKAYDEDWGHLYESRRRGHLEASTSAPLFPASVLHNSSSHEEQQLTANRWWDKNKSATVNPETSFLEPPNFVHRRDHYYDNISDKSEEEEEEETLDWRITNRMSKSFIMDDLNGADFDLPFDIYRKQPGNPDEDLGALDNV